MREHLIYQIVSNNPLIKKEFDNVYFIEGPFEDVLIKVRDLVHKGYKLISHPLNASIRMFSSPYRSIIIGQQNQKNNYFHIEIIENSIVNYKKHIDKRKIDTKNIHDYALMDSELLKSTLKGLTINPIINVI